MMAALRRDGEGLRGRGPRGVAGRRRSGRAPVRALPARRRRGRGEGRPARGEGVRGEEGARIEKFYKENPARFDQKKKVRVRHVLARVAPGGRRGRREEEDRGRRGAREEGRGLREGRPGALGRREHEGARRRARVRVGGALRRAFAKAALALEPGQVSEPVRSPSGWHLVKAEEVVPAKQVSLDDARATIARELLVKDRASALARERAQAALDGREGGSARSRAVKRAGRRPSAPEETGPFGRVEPVRPEARRGAGPARGRARGEGAGRCSRGCTTRPPARSSRS